MHNSGSFLRKLIGLSLSAVVATVTAVVVAPTPVAAAGGSVTDWMHDGRFGVMEHYLAEGCPPGCDVSDYPNNMPTVEAWNDRVNHYDIEGVVQQLKSIGAGWLQIAVGQNTGFFSAPNSTYDALVPSTADHPSRLSKRDLIKELGAALHKEGIRLLVYTTDDAIQRDDYARKKLGGDSQEAGAPNATYQENWLKVMKTWSQQWGTDVDGYWVDGPYYQDLEPFYDQVAANLRSGNPNALVSFNGGATNGIGSVTTQSDFNAGETDVDDWSNRPTDGRWIDNRGTQMQLQYLAIAQGYWGKPPDTPMSFSAEELAGHTLSVNRVGGAVTWDVGYDRSNGHISDLAMAQLKKVGQTVGKLPTALVGVGSNRCVDVPGASTADGTDVQLYDCNGTAAQKWRFNPENGEVRALGKCLDVEQGNANDGTPVQLYSCNGTGAQRWTYDPTSKQLTAFGKCLDASGGATANGTKVIIATCHGRDNQQWRLGA
ncbi:ricin-type beta-trefoil lectin domain protein [Streptomyces rhizosphaericus]|uniref:ricin-type beta-trefoil lectin domain protein n=1 Tax=Streptomyces rhizosphaericus TaxID=114699 RepID=UPI00142E85DA|nr:ricin-type beta-trefoil lectin domain protein [Streptomyces rhizosphaericus]